MKIKPSSILFALGLFALCSSALVIFGQPTNTLATLPYATTAPTAPEPEVRIFGLTVTEIAGLLGLLGTLAMYIGRILASFKAGTSVIKALFGGSAPAVKALQEQVKTIPVAIETSDTRYLVKAIVESKEEKKTL